MNLPPTLVAVCVALGFGYAAFGTVTVVSDAAWGVRLWPLELAVAGLAGWASWRWFGRLQSGQARSPRPDRGERAIWRLSYRRRGPLSLEEITQDTLLDEGAALAALRSLESQGQAERLEDGRWQLKV